MSDKLTIKSEMAALDGKQRGFYDSLTPEERKKFSTFLMLRWGSCVTGSVDLAGYYLISCNERLNKYYFDLGKHPKLQWLLTTTISPGMGNQYHQWIPLMKKGATDNKLRKFVTLHYPHLKDDEVTLWIKLNDRADFEHMARELGYDDRRIKDELG